MTSSKNGMMETVGDSKSICFGILFVRCSLVDGLGKLYNNCETDMEVYLICCPYF